MKNVLREFASIASVQFMLMMVVIALILIFYDSKKLNEKGATTDAKVAKGFGISYLILGIGLYIAGKMIG
ncbi:MAG: hypothetical protein H7X94_01945 [Vallitaleaceae bacterium]|nr:hypothetical protein [Vallitaleaceae bacterium]